ncbi:hypothetical protein C8J56DRAFT_889018 [Mycena floridula]|nr:hypothetical protein C8J56DRAFT_889018 [Mycena floridula]
MLNLCKLTFLALSAAKVAAGLSHSLSISSTRLHESEGGLTVELCGDSNSGSGCLNLICGNSPEGCNNIPSTWKEPIIKTQRNPPILLKDIPYLSKYEDMAVVVGCGVQVAVYISSARYFWNRRREQSNFLFLGYMTVFLVLEGVAVLTRKGFALFYGSVFTITVLGDVLMLRHCWTMASTATSLKFAALPGVGIILFTILATFCTFGSLKVVPIIITVIVASRILLYRILPKKIVMHYLVFLLLTFLIEYIALYGIFALIVVRTSIGGRANEVLVALAALCQVGTSCNLWIYISFIRREATRNLHVCTWFGNGVGRFKDWSSVMKATARDYLVPDTAAGQEEHLGIKLTTSGLTLESFPAPAANHRATRHQQIQKKTAQE